MMKIAGIPPDLDQHGLTQCGWLDPRCGLTSRDVGLTVIVYHGLITSLCVHHAEMAKAGL